MRQALWPEYPLEQLVDEIAPYESTSRIWGLPTQVFVAERDSDRRLCGFIEVSLRPYADACHAPPIAYVEAWYVDEEYRRRSVGRSLVESAQAWAISQGCTEMASDCNADNHVSYRAHQRIGFEPTIGYILFRKPLSEAVQRRGPDLVAIVPYRLSAESAVKWVTDAGAGGIDVFLGTTRQESAPDGRELVALDYEAYTQMAQEQLQELVRKARRRWPIVRLALLHRVGRVALGEPSVIIAVATPHRGHAFEACRFLIDQLKVDVAIWKKEVWDDGSASWVHPGGGTNAE